VIRPLRQRHRHMVIALGVFLPIAFATGIAARRSVPSMASLPAALSGMTQKFAVEKWERNDLFSKSPIQARLLTESAKAGRCALQLSAASDFLKPDLIVYWVSGDPTITDVLPDDSILLGSFSSVALPLPEEASRGQGVIVLFSLADYEIVDASKPIRLNDPIN